MKRSLLFAVLVVLLVTSCDGKHATAEAQAPLLAPDSSDEVTQDYEAIPSLQLDTKTSQEEPEKVAVLFLVDRSKSLTGCTRIQSRIDVPYFLISLFQSVPQKMVGWPMMGIKFFGEEKTYLDVQPVSEISFDINDYSNKLPSYDMKNDY